MREKTTEEWIECPVCGESIYNSEENKMDAYRHDQRCSYSLLEEVAEEM
ncbi:hypothetical protein HZS55_12125 [Halosimplex rubrum]|uniref:Uncharacterized protein n=1 Tax=Halosimplex rubrum TaxID=869889 RepID=A0A7D5PA10_9EURY|nr:hypothetical protein [Halosimplex rubrum]QLH78000.1 hypothetical protein HZS55_12125 [Halosimplex rubrum]